ncbi:hypothetical protein [Virgibacillus sp. MG-45]|uniref:hypothetical protein n=1 Tax=Virgibacillus sp. MG-45 TaxID=3102791 RepID=UPI002ED9DE1F
MTKSTLEALLLHLMSNIEMINPSSTSKEEMAQEIKADLISEWKEFQIGRGKKK